MNCLAVVAHPDDETLFMGGTLHALRAESWKIVCLTHDHQHGRDPQFLEVCRRIGAEGVNLGLEMRHPAKSPGWDRMKLLRQLGDILCERTWDRIYTHNLVGEYGHVQHSEVHGLMKVFGRALWTFGPGDPAPNEAQSLTPEDREFKRELAGVYALKTKALMAYPFFEVEREEFFRTPDLGRV